MIAAVIPLFVITLCNISHLVLATFFFPSIVEFLDDLHWGFTHRSSYIEYMDSTKTEGTKLYINHSKHSILNNKANNYEKHLTQPTIVSYYGEVSAEFDKYLRFRENRKMLQQASDDAVLIRKQNFRARVHERMLEQPVNEKQKMLSRVR